MTAWTEATYDLFAAHTLGYLAKNDMTKNTALLEVTEWGGVATFT